MGMQKALAVIAIATATAHADAAPDATLIHAELDPLTFANQPGYGGQIGIRPRDFKGVRVAIASFALHVPDFLGHVLLGDIDYTVRPSGAIYGLYYFKDPGLDGFAVGASVRLLRIHYEQEDDPSYESNVTEISPELIVGYQWHPMKGRFYLQPWFALGVTAYRSGSLALSNGSNAPVIIDPLPVSPFFTVNIGYEYAL